MSKNKVSAKRICSVCIAAVLITSAFTACTGQDTNVTDNNQPKSSSTPTVSKNGSQKPAESVMGKTVANGKCGENVTYTLDENGTLLISGSGKMEDFDFEVKEGTRWFPEIRNTNKVIIESGVTSIGQYAFTNCKFLESITIPDSVTSIGDYAFNNCNSLKSVTIPDSVKSIGDSPFANCNSLESVNIPAGVTSIGDLEYMNCTSLKIIIIPDSVTSIGDYAFAYCENLESITIPDSVTKIGDLAFNECDSLTIHAQKGSVAEKYANDNNIKFVAE